MNNRMLFRGGFVFRDDLGLQDSIDALGGTAITESFIQRVAGSTLRIQCTTSAPATKWEATCAALRDIAAMATRGYCNAQFDPGRGEASVVRHRYHAGGNVEHVTDPFDDE